MKPTLWITNWSSKKIHGPGRKLSIMAMPRPWEHGDGRIPCLTPDSVDLRLVRDGHIGIDEYRRRFEAKVAESEDRLKPGILGATTRFSGAFAVRDGDTLCCACSRDDAAAGRCHRVWAAEALARAGWRVILDGVEVQP
jgi:hypothetical protein